MEPTRGRRHAALAMAVLPAALRAFSLLALSLLAACASAPPRAPATADTARILLAALDGEGLYTVAGGIKPVSEGFWHGNVAVDAADLAAVQATRAALAPWRNDELWADVHVFDAAYEGKRSARAYVVERRALAELLRARADFFAPYGLAPDTHPAEVMAVVERMPKLDRHRGLGLLFGYPQHAIDFFVAADAERAPGEPPLPRRFVQIPTFASPTGRFVYAVAKDDPERPADRALADAAAPVLARYRALRDALPAAADAETVLALAATLRREFAAQPATAPTR